MTAIDAGDQSPEREENCARNGAADRNETPVAFAKILGVRLGRFVEFEYFLDEGVLAVELILPLAAFHEFCRARNATILAPTAPEQASELQRLSWREKQPGLLQQAVSAENFGSGRNK